MSRSNTFPRRRGSAWSGYTGTRPEAAERESADQWERDLEATAELERQTEAAVPKKHRLRVFVRRLTRGS